MSKHGHNSRDTQSFVFFVWITFRSDSSPFRPQKNSICKQNSFIWHSTMVSTISDCGVVVVFAIFLALFSNILTYNNENRRKFKKILFIHHCIITASVYYQWCPDGDHGPQRTSTAECGTRSFIWIKGIITFKLNK